MRYVFKGMMTLLAAIGTLILLAIALIGGALWLTLPSRDQTTRLPGLSAPIDIVMDQDGIPRIRAANDRDAAMALGYLHARDRMFQMELMRRAASGRLSELAGAMTLGFDRTMRVLGAHHRAEQDVAGLPPETRDMLDAYAAGVNSRIAERGRFIAPEFLVLGPPEPWQPHHTLLWGKTMGLWLSANWRTELSRLALMGRVPDAVIDQLWPPKTDAGRPEAASTRSTDGPTTVMAGEGPPSTTFLAPETQVMDGRPTPTMTGRHPHGPRLSPAGSPHRHKPGRRTPGLA